MEVAVEPTDDALAAKRAKRAAYMREYHQRKKSDPEYLERVRAMWSRWAANNPEKAKAAKRKYDEANREKNRQRLAKYRAENREKDRAAKDAYNQRNPEKRLAACRKRQASLWSATPAWANEFFIEEAYRLAKLRSEVTGLKWEVDHIVPLRSKLVCGLHVEHNLAVVPRKVNQAKGNRYWPDMPEEIV